MSCAAGRALPRHVLPDPPRPAGERLQRRARRCSGRSNKWCFHLSCGTLLSAGVFECRKDCFVSSGNTSVLVSSSHSLSPEVPRVSSPPEGRPGCRFVHLLPRLSVKGFALKHFIPTGLWTVVSHCRHKPVLPMSAAWGQCWGAGDASPPRRGSAEKHDSGLQNARSWSGQGFLVKAERNRDYFGLLLLLGQSLVLFGCFGGR